ncbi:transporter substrate-binding domain-containing protein [Vibrio sp. IB15]|jgi:polar amino acid transport system substrate-binding protein|uniref:Transporter substrate-binding domain-containing protein n=1 Tax=Vibrio chagasii TaxID=170679 RepID=A0A7Y4DSN4_9VIBR|nr:MULTISPECIES: transporter substrate-binding domain-containing protein [Vibrio]MEC7940818.1 transporter substrate-binding domain-containing protein [Pseudomonadota bacterium]KAB0475155.1 transporter substrate-binding domain-containing protein [Vibrio chagasii]MBJ2145246.1 transporter substrate-binding domain-containing protein [Vibrio sp. IB15]MCG9554706.1 transporter substrate-binding domain-containing protein [Vibrio sp. Isolate32]MCG9561296.1 transporter substrate-binding domain-containin|tara:strand:- start:40 stop:849 length:810 start_codon:yes stop_codon:yes gene_type:complete
MKLFKTAITALLALAVSLPALASETPNLDKINERGSLRVGMSTFVPWAMRNKQGDLVGFEIDVAKRLAEDSGWKVEFVPTAWDGIIPSLLSNKFDVIIGGMSITEARAKSVLFTEPYSHSGVQLAANKELAEGFSKISDFDSRRVKIAARRGAFTVQVARETFPKAKVLQFDDDAQAFQEVLNGNAHAVIASSPKPEHEAIKNADTLFIPFDERLSKGNEAFAVRLGETDKAEFFNEWIKARTEDGWLKERYEYWFSTLDWQDQIAQGQ